MLLVPIDPLLLFSHISFSLFHFSLTMLVTLRMLCACLIFNIQRNYTYTFDLVLIKIILINKAGASYNRPFFFSCLIVLVLSGFIFLLLCLSLVAYTISLPFRSFHQLLLVIFTLVPSRNVVEDALFLFYPILQ